MSRAIENLKSAKQKAMQVVQRLVDFRISPRRSAERE
jgi:hypothetical protein